MCWYPLSAKHCKVEETLLVQKWESMYFRAALLQAPHAPLLHTDGTASAYHPKFNIR